jgi:hypothetical protein
MKSRTQTGRWRARDPLQQLVEVVFAEALGQLQPLVVENEALDDELAQGLGSPDAELRSLSTVDR